MTIKLNELTKTISVEIKVTNVAGEEISLQELRSSDFDLYCKLKEQLKEDIDARVAYLSSEEYRSGEFNGQCIIDVEASDDDEVGEEVEEVIFNYNGWIYLSTEEDWFNKEREEIVI